MYNLHWHSALHALTHMSKRIIEDNNNAAKFADILEKYEFVDINRNLVQTNIVRFKLRGDFRIKNIVQQNIVILAT